MLGQTALLLALAGCSGPNSYYPVDWWRQLEGGRIAEARPAPPRADDPYPHLGSVPTRPAGTDPAARARIAGNLVSDRSNAQYASQLAPLAAAPPAAPAVRPAQPAPAPGAEDSSASLTAASAPTPAPLPAAQQAASQPAPAPAPAPASAPATAPAATPAAAANTTPGQARPAAPLDTLPDMAAAPPPPPALPGVARFTPPVPPPVKPVAPAVVAPPAPGAPVTIPFAADRAILPEGAAAALGVLAKRRGAAPILIAGYGEAPAADPDTQAAALPLAMARADAMRVALNRAGVPDTAMRISAEALGRGGLARIAD